MGESITPREDRERRVAHFNATFGQASRLASEHGLTLKLVNRSGNQYQLLHNENGWLLNLYANVRGAVPRAYHDKNRKGPFLRLPLGAWTLKDAVLAAARDWCSQGGAALRGRSDGEF
jgi:hypothetical protein